MKWPRQPMALSQDLEFSFHTKTVPGGTPTGIMERPGGFSHHLLSETIRSFYLQLSEVASYKFY